MKILGLYGSPRKAGNTDKLLDKALEGARNASTEIFTLYARELKISGCIECGGCDTTGICVIRDDMDLVYPLLEQSDIIFLSSPIFFYGVPSQIKALIDRCQALWCKRRLEKGPGPKNLYQSGRGFLIAVGATRGENLFEGVQLTARYFYDALDMSYGGGVFFRCLEKETAVDEHPETLQEAYTLGRKTFSG